MKVPYKIQAYCPGCNEPTEHTVSIYKKGRERVLSLGARRHERELHGYGGQKYPIQKKKSKTTDKKTLMLRCGKCNRTVSRETGRLKKLEIVR